MSEGQTTHHTFSFWWCAQTQLSPASITCWILKIMELQSSRQSSRLLCWLAQQRAQEQIAKHLRELNWTQEGPQQSV
jgi:hypothetical protein